MRPCQRPKFGVGWRLTPTLRDRRFRYDPQTKGNIWIRRCAAKAFTPSLVVWKSSDVCEIAKIWKSCFEDISHPPRRHARSPVGHSIGDSDASNRTIEKFPRWKSEVVQWRDDVGNRRKVEPRLRSSKWKGIIQLVSSFLPMCCSKYLCW